MGWWETTPQRDSMPWGSRMPVSTEQVLHPDRYQRGDAPVELRFSSGPAPVYEDLLGELEARVLEAELTGGSAESEVPLGWGGDRYRVYRTLGGQALVWFAVWDEPRHADRFATRIARPFIQRARPGYRSTVDRIELGGRAAVRVVAAPSGWEGWGALPAAELSR
jgi:hypothetical protein